MIQISGGKSALWWEQKRQMSGGKSDKLGGGKSNKGKWTTTGGKTCWGENLRTLNLSRYCLSHPPPLDTQNCLPQDCLPVGNPEVGNVRGYLFAQVQYQTFYHKKVLVWLKIFNVSFHECVP